MKRSLAFAVALSLLLPAAALSQTGNNTGAGSPSQNQSAKPSKPKPPGNTKPSKPRPPSVGKPSKPKPPSAGKPSKPKPPPSAGKPSKPRPPMAGKPPRGRPAGYRPLPPRGNQFWHRGAYFNRIAGPAYIWPRGWHYRTWSIGVRFPTLFLTPAYFYDGWAALNLEEPAPGYAWVRFGPDLILVNLHTHEVEDVALGVFL
jgi:Ni/Co efflux regulator RcnB